MVRSSKSVDSIEVNPREIGFSPPQVQRLRVEYWPIERLKPYERNPRKNDKAVDRNHAINSFSAML